VLTAASWAPFKTFANASICSVVKLAFEPT
jgi:hypothetical protein